MGTAKRNRDADPTLQRSPSAVFASHAYGERAAAPEADWRRSDGAVRIEMEVRLHAVLLSEGDFVEWLPHIPLDGT